MKKPAVSFRVNALLARKTWGEISKTAMRGLKELTSTHSLSVAAGDLQFWMANGTSRIPAYFALPSVVIAWASTQSSSNSSPIQRVIAGFSGQLFTNFIFP